jgi:hypothetical protein
MSSQEEAASPARLVSENAEITWSLLGPYECYMNKPQPLFLSNPTRSALLPIHCASFTKIRQKAGKLL